MKIAHFALIALSTGSVIAAPATQPATLFDPARHMRVDEVKPGMKGYGLSVFYGSKIEKFDVEVVSVLNKFNPKRDVVLIRCQGQNLEHTGSIQGMSGSPIFLTDDSGKSRMIGAFAYGFPFAKDPIAGVQPIEYMLELPTAAHTDEEIEGSAGQTGNSARSTAWSVTDAMAKVRTNWLSPPQVLQQESTQLSPLATPISVSGISAEQLRDLMPVFAANNLSLLQAGGGSSGSTTAESPVSIEPGSVLAAPVLTGDVQLIATGTVTEVQGENVFGFGHPFNSEGPIALPFGSGRINGIVAALTSSYKLGAIDQVRGTLNTDQSVGVAGKLGEAPKTIPVDIEVKYADGSVPPEQYHFDMAQHPIFSPMMTGVAMTAALGGSREVPRNHTIDYDVNVEFANGRKIHTVNRVVNGGPRAVAAETVLPVQLGIENPFKKLMPSKITASLTITSTALNAAIVSGRLNKQTYRPGEVATGYLYFRPFRGDEKSMPIEFPLPRDLPEGQYQLTVGDADHYLAEEITLNAWKFAATDIDSMMDAIQTASSIRKDAVYVRLVRPGDGVAIGRVALPKLPASRRALLMASGRGDVSMMSSGGVKIIPTSLVFEGAAELAITVEANPHADHTSAGAGKPTANPNPTTPPQRAVTP